MLKQRYSSCRVEIRMSSKTMNSTATTRTVGLAEQTVWLTAAKFIALMISIVLPLVLVRKLGRAEFGLYRQAFQVVATAFGLLNLQVASSMYYFMPRGKKPQVVMNVTLFYGVVGSVVALLFALGLAGSQSFSKVMIW